ncbi:cytochrome c-type biogenesis protein CcmH [Bacillus sp. DNRA2]|uniref:cytochrome c-type biogenesis protein n=1 Tax=Bacillus sp. DNRA2 TaxID=2723053 RepID=UPI00145F2CD1|nr:cytochrome c-type biogenesis protein [Bacillus sp. DNRA2]NMD71803.1 cytochrome c-type biogenesis protein CcmH [Bacillus sp. DNRA2]
MNKKISIGLLLILFIFQGAFAVLGAENKTIDLKSPEFKAVASQFLCTCGCGQDHFACDMAGCKNTETFKAELVDMMEKGMNKDEIREYYVKALGEEILTAPEKKGFSLAAWILPFAAIGGAGTGVFFVVRKWVKKNANGQDMLDDQLENDEVEEEILSSIIEEERKKYL